MVRLNFSDVCFHCGIMMRYASIDSKVFKQSKEGEYRYQKSYKQKISRCLLFYIWVRLPSVLSIKIKQSEKGRN